MEGTDLAATDVDDYYFGNNWMSRIRGGRVQSSSPTSTLVAYNTVGEHDLEGIDLAAADDYDDDDLSGNNRAWEY